MSVCAPSSRVCDVCGVLVSLKQLFVCGRCTGKFYCGQECQKRDWKEHKRVCVVSVAKNVIRGVGCTSMYEDLVRDLEDRMANEEKALMAGTFDVAVEGLEKVLEKIRKSQEQDAERKALSFAIVMSKLAFCYLSMRNYNACLSYVELARKELKQFDPNIDRIILELFLGLTDQEATCLSHMGKHKKAVAVIEAEETVSGRNIPNHLMLKLLLTKASIFVETGEVKKGHGACDAALELVDSDLSLEARRGEVLFACAKVQESRNKFPEAMKLYKKVCDFGEVHSRNKWGCVEVDGNVGMTHCAYNEMSMILKNDRLPDNVDSKLREIARLARKTIVVAEKFKNQRAIDSMHNILNVQLPGMIRCVKEHGFLVSDNLHVSKQKNNICFLKLRKPLDLNLNSLIAPFVEQMDEGNYAVALNGFNKIAGDLLASESFLAFAQLAVKISECNRNLLQFDAAMGILNNASDNISLLRECNNEIEYFETVLSVYLEQSFCRLAMHEVDKALNAGIAASVICKDHCKVLPVQLLSKTMMCVINAHIASSNWKDALQLLEIASNSYTSHITPCERLTAYGKICTLQKKFSEAREAFHNAIEGAIGFETSRSRAIFVVEAREGLAICLIREVLTIAHSKKQISYNLQTMLHSAIACKDEAFNAALKFNFGQHVDSIATSWNEFRPLIKAQFEKIGLIDMHF